jgi:uncharacterized protein YbjT (DUF2867 family)
MSVLVIGGKGLVGGQASRRLLREGYQVATYREEVNLWRRS